MNLGSQLSNAQLIGSTLDCTESRNSLGAEPKPYKVVRFSNEKSLLRISDNLSNDELNTVATENSLDAHN